MKKINKKEKIFWNDSNIVKYFSNKPADPRIYKRLLKVKNSKTLKALDLGCGGGRHTELLYNLGFQAYACDINPEMVAYTKRRLREITKKVNVLKNIIAGDILRIPFSNNIFDVVITTGVLHQAKSLKNYQDAIKELSRVCKNKCIVCLNIFTNKVIDKSYKRVKNSKFTYITKEGLWMTLLPKNVFYKMMLKEGFHLEEEICEEIKQENTGPRAVLRCNFIKS